MQLLVLATLCLDLSAWSGPSAHGMTDLRETLEPLRKELKFPALAAAVVRDGKITAAGVSGTRTWQREDTARLDDKFHIGSCTKSFTALLAILNRDRIPLETKIAEVFPEWQLPTGSSNITLRLLLQNLSGLGNKPGSALWANAFNARGEPRLLRRSFLQGFLKQPLDAAPGEKYIYSNPGFALAGAMIEERMNTPWEELVRRQIFGPLKLSSAGFGPLEPPGQPQGHQFVGGTPQARPPVDNPVAIAPAGLIHMSILDLARYAALHASIARGDIPELAGERKHLYEPPAKSHYALGWLVVQREWANGSALTHAGSNTIYHTVIWIAPERNFAVVVSTNIGDSRDSRVAEACEKVISQLIQEWLSL